MDTAVVLTDMNECAAEMVRLFASAVTSIFYSAFVSQLDVPLPNQSVTLRQLMTAATTRGVKVHVFYNPSVEYGNAPMASLGLPPEVEVRQVMGNGIIPAPFNRVFGDRYTNHHQKFCMVDDRVMLVGGVGVHPCRAGWLQLNTESPPYYWHEVGVMVPTTPAMTQWVRNCWASRMEPPPPPLVAATSEHATMVRLIRTARTCVHLEAQLCISTSTTANQVLAAVVDRVVAAWEATTEDPFVFMMLVNTLQPDEHPVVSAATTASLHWSRRFLADAITARGVPSSFMTERVFLGTLEHNGVHIKVHSNLMIVDGHTMIRSSSNLTDRSLSAAPCDNELGIVIHGNVVAATQQKLWSMYFQIPNQVWRPREAFALMTQQTGLVQPIMFHSTHNSTFLPSWLVNGVMQVVTSLPFFGGVKNIQWNVE